MRSQVRTRFVAKPADSSTAAGSVYDRQQTRGVC